MDLREPEPSSVAHLASARKNLFEGEEANEDNENDEKVRREAEEWSRKSMEDQVL